MGISIWHMGYRYGIRYIDAVIYHIDMVILDIDKGCGLMIWEMTVLIWVRCGISCHSALHPGGQRNGRGVLRQRHLLLTVL